MSAFQRGFLTKPAVKQLLATWPGPETDDEREDRERRERSKRIVDQEIQAWLDRRERQR